MASKWTVTPDSKKIDLVWVNSETGDSESFWIKIKKKLTVGEKRRSQTAGFGAVRGSKQAGHSETDSEITMDWKAMSFARMEVWLLDWSLTDDADKKIAVTREAIESLHEEVFELIEGAITAHVEALDDAKKSRVTETESKESSTTSA